MGLLEGHHKMTWKYFLLRMLNNALAPAAVIVAVMLGWQASVVLLSAMVFTQLLQDASFMKAMPVVVQSNAMGGDSKHDQNRRP